MNTNNQLQTKTETMRSYLDSNVGFKAACEKLFIPLREDGKFVNAGDERKFNQFKNSLSELFFEDKNLQQCDKFMIMNNAAKVANMGLSLVKSIGDAYLVPYKNQPTLIIGYMGWVRLALNSGLYKRIIAEVVYEGEYVRYDKLANELELQECDSDRKGRVKGFVASFTIIHPVTRIEYRHTVWMDVKEMCRYAKSYSKSIPQNVTVEQLEEKMNNPYTGNGIGWMSDPNAMAKKTVLKKLLTKWGIVTREIETAMASDNEEGDKAVENRSETIETAKQSVIDPDAEDVVFEEAKEVDPGF